MRYKNVCAFLFMRVTYFVKILGWNDIDYRLFIFAIKVFPSYFRVPMLMMQRHWLLCQTSASCPVTTLMMQQRWQWNSQTSLPLPRQQMLMSSLSYQCKWNWRKEHDKLRREKDRVFNNSVSDTYMFRNSLVDPQGCVSIFYTTKALKLQ